MTRCNDMKLKREIQDPNTNSNTSSSSNNLPNHDRVKPHEAFFGSRNGLKDPSFENLKVNDESYAFKSADVLVFEQSEIKNVLKEKFDICIGEDGAKNIIQDDVDLIKKIKTTST
ncbi:hypothetical protein CR513_11444, partial [Mucuna pruriens]